MDESIKGWPALPYEEWRGTRDTLHTYAQVLGKLRLALSPFEPQWGNVPLYLTARGLTTSPLPVGPRTVDAELDLISHEVVIRSSLGEVERRPLGGAVADYYQDVTRMLRRLNVEVAISTRPSEVPDPIPFPEDRTHDVYVEAHAARFFRVISRIDVVTKEHRARFRGRTTPVQLYWGSFDLALARFSGRTVEPPRDRGIIERLGGDAEEICAGWWPGDEKRRSAAFFAYGYPSPNGIDRIGVRPEEAGWNEEAGEFLLPYEAVRSKSDPRRAILDFFETTYDGAARLMGWDADLIRPAAT